MSIKKTDFLKFGEDLYEVIPPAPSEEDRGGVIASPATEAETIEAKLGDDGKLYVGADPAGSAAAALALANENIQTKFDELSAVVDGKANTTAFTSHTNNSEIHVTQSDKDKWDLAEPNQRAFTRVEVNDDGYSASNSIASTMRFKNGTGIELSITNKDSDADVTITNTGVTGVKGDSESTYRTGNVNVTKANIGLSNVDNTKDTNKPVSIAQQTAIDNALSESKDYTDEKVALLLNNSSAAVDSIMELATAMEENEEVVDALEQAIGNKADKTHEHNDVYYTETEIDTMMDDVVYLDIEDNEDIPDVAGGSNIVVDSALSTTSTNPVQNKVVTEKFNQVQEQIADKATLENGVIKFYKTGETNKELFSVDVSEIGGTGGLDLNNLTLSVSQVGDYQRLSMSDGTTTKMVDIPITAITDEQVQTAVSKAIADNPNLVSTVQAKEITIDKLSNVTGIIDMVKQIPTTGQALRLGALTTAKTGDSIVIPVQPNDVVHYVIHAFSDGVDYFSEYTRYGLWDASKNLVSKDVCWLKNAVGQEMKITIPEGCYYIAFPLVYENTYAEMSVYVNPTGSVLTDDEQLKELYGLPLSTSLEFEKYMEERVKKVNPNFKYKGRITGFALPYLTTAEKYDCYLYSGPRLYEAYDDIVQTGDLIYSLGSTVRWKKAKLPYDTELMTIAETHCDICIVGGGAGGVACAYALKDSGYNVVLVEQLDSLGGTHTNAGVIELLPSPVPEFLKPICKDAYDNGFLNWKKSSYSIGSDEETDFDKWWRGGFINYAKAGASWGNYFDVNPMFMSDRYYKDLSPTIDIRFNRKFVSHKETDGVINSIQCENKNTGGIETIYAHYFIDCTADGTLSRYGKTLDTDYFIGADAKALYNESAIKDGFEGNHYEINSLEPTYLYNSVNGNPLIFEKPTYKPDSTVGTSMNNKWNIPHKVNGTTSGHATWTKIDGSSVTDGYYYTFMIVTSPDLHAGLTAEDYIDKGYEYTYAKGANNAKAHFDKTQNEKSRYMGICKLLAIRETYRIKCDKMLVQSDIETLATSENIANNHYIALSSWYVDMHSNVSVNKDSIAYRQLFGIPYECTIPTAYKNVLVACRGAGFSHIAASACRLTKTMMSLGWSVGKAVAQARANWIDDMRNVDVAQLQTDCGVLEQLSDIETYFTLS